MKTKIKALTLGLAAFATLATVQAQVINVNFHAGRDLMNGTVNSMPAEYQSTTWNDILDGTSTNLADTFGNSTGIELSLSTVKKYGADSIGLPVLKDYRYFGANASSVGMSLTLTNVTPGVEYDIYLLSQGNANGRTTRFALGEGAMVANSSIAANDNSNPLVQHANALDQTALTWTENGNYVKFSAVTSTVSGTIVIEMSSLSGNNNGSLNGLQIVDLSAAGPDFTTAVTPGYGETYVTNLPAIEIEATDGTLDVDPTSFSMELVTGGVTNDVTVDVIVDTPSSSVTTFSYTPIVPLENYADYTIQYSLAGIGGMTNGFISTFTTAPDVLFTTTPEDGALYVATNSEVSVTFTNVAVSLSNLFDSAELIVNSVDMSGALVISYPTNGIMKFEYVHGGLDFSTNYDIELNVSRSDGYTNTVEFSFESALDSSVYLVAPGIRNGGFELVDGASGFVANMTDWNRIDDWADDSGAGAKTEAIGSPSEGTRALTTGAGSLTYNDTGTAISNGDIFEFKWTVPGRPNGVYVGLAYMDGGPQIVSNSLVYTSGTIGEFGGSYLFDSIKDPDAIGKNVAIVIIDDNTGGGAVYVDEVRLYYGNIAVQSVSPAADATGVANTAPVQVVIAEAASQVDTNTIALSVDGADVTAEAVINDTASGVTITYSPTNVWAVGRHYISISADGAPEGTAAQSWSFLVDPTGSYLISPTLRNGSFELVSGAQGSGTVSDWSQIDDWSDDSGAGAKTEDNNIASDGSRIFVTGGGSETYNMTTTTISNGDRFGYSMVNVGRANGATVALAYEDGGSIVVVSNSSAFVSGGSTPQLVSGEFTFTTGTAPDAIGKTIGVIIIDDNVGGGAVQFDEVRLYKDETQPTEDPVITEFSISGGTITLSYTSEDLGLYSLQSKPSMSDFVDWVTVLSNLPSGNLTTNIPMGDEETEFFRVISE